MNYRIIILALFLLQVSILSFAKQKSCFKQSSFDIGFSLNGGTSIGNIAVSASQNWKMPWLQKNLYIGLGVRINSSFGFNNLDYETAQIDLRRESNFIFSPKVHAQIDTLNLESTQSNSINALLNIAYQKNKFGIELGLDLAGFSFGAEQNATLFYGEHSEAYRNVKAKPAPRNALLFGDNNIGMLQSSLCVQYQLKKNLKLLVGASKIRTEYIIDNPVIYTTSTRMLVNTDRYMKNSYTFLIGTRYTIKSKKS